MYGLREVSVRAFTLGVFNMTSSESPSAVIGIGASAGGVEALRTFFGSALPNSGLAFVVYLHFPPDATSHLVGILAPHTSLPVTLAVDGDVVEANHVYVVPPGRVATIASGTMVMEDKAAVDKPIDVLFLSLAAAFGSRAVGVVLSGTGSDGTRGIEAISRCGGFTIAQASGGENDNHRGMPSSAIATGLVDEVLAVSDMPVHIEAYVNGLAAEDPLPQKEATPHQFKGVKDELCRLLQAATRNDFSRYKASTFLRRVARRMQLLNLTDWNAYVDHARGDPDEVVALFSDLLIGVTAFFRDDEAFTHLETTVIPDLFKGKSRKDRVRVWVTGCSSGEEAYSIAILLLDHARTLDAPPQIQLFATDVDEAALRVARAGRYSETALAGLSDDRRERFFASDRVAFVASKELRSICTFAVHSVIRDPPLSSIDLISCRNVLIYFDRHLQDQVVPTFHFALRPGGILFLGPSETIGRHTDLFHALDGANRIYERIGTARRSLPFLPLSRERDTRSEDVLGKKSRQPEKTVAQSADAQVLQRFGPANVVVNARGDIVHFSHRTGNYLEPIHGNPNHNLLAMARKGLRISLRSALHEAQKNDRVVVRDNISVELQAGAVQKVRVVVEPLEHAGAEPLWLVTFTDIGEISLQASAAPLDADAVGADVAIQQLEHELQDTRASLQTAIDEYEIAIEELRSSNEELMSMNDDLQASNEEIEASKEELHVVNDELGTVNADLTVKIEELKQANADLRNLLDASQIAVVFLDRNLVIRSFTRAVTEMFRLVPLDRGRFLTDIISYIDYDTLDADIATAVETRETVERAVLRRDGNAHYLLRIVPYLTLEGDVNGTLVILVNVSAAVEAQAQAHHAQLMIGEMSHRIKNILTVVASMAMQTLRGTTDSEQFASVFQGRLEALSKAHDLLSNENWAQLPLHDLIVTGLGLQGASNERVTLDGGPICLLPKAATTLSLVLHELFTNATKYGAFSNTTGHIDIKWAQEMRPDGAFLVIRWRESGGPPVTTPTRKGFGSEMILRGIKYDLRGSSAIDYRPSGVEVQICIPLDGARYSAPGSAEEGFLHGTD